MLLSCLPVEDHRDGEGRWSKGRKEVGSLGPRKDGLNVASFFFSSSDFLLFLFFSCSILIGKERNLKRSANRFQA
jgi:hypothetical protein